MCSTLKWTGGLAHSKPCSFSEPTYCQDSVDKLPSFPKNHLTHDNGGFFPSKGRFPLFHNAHQPTSNSTSFLGRFSQIRLHDHHLFHAPKVLLLSGSSSQQSTERRRTSSLLGSAESLSDHVRPGNQGKHPESESSPVCCWRLELSPRGLSARAVEGTTSPVFQSAPESWMACEAGREGDEAQERRTPVPPGRERPPDHRRGKRRTSASHQATHLPSQA